VITIALPYSGNIAAAVVQARAGQLRTVHLDSMTVAALQSFEVVAPVVVVGCKQSLDLIRGRNDVIHATEGKKP
jgi:hypothetical protein